jgi:O-antigen ligase
MRLFGAKAYVSVVALVLLPVLLVISGGLFRGLRHNAGWLWVGFFACMLAAGAFSFFHRGSLDLILYYLPRSYVLYFYVTAFALSVRSLSRFMYVMIIADALLLISCRTSGYLASDGRFQIYSSFWGNSNDLALALLIAAVQFIYLIRTPRMLARILGCVGFLGCLFYMSRTGSRGAMLALGAAMVSMFFMTKRKTRFIVLATPAFAAFFLFASGATLRRLVTLSTSVTGNEDLGAVASQMSREQLFLSSIDITLHHPLVGIGPGQFAAYYFADVTSKGGWTGWLGTHNSYTQVSSECGIPALICYSGVLFSCLFLAFRMYRRSVDVPPLEEINRLSFILATALVVYAVATFFFHMAYTGLLPSLAGTTVALYLASRKTFAKFEIKL